MLMHYLKDRRHYIRINSANSEILINGEYSVSQGSVMSGLLFLIFTMDMPNILHQKPHSNHIEDYNCTLNSYNVNFVDDSYRIIQAHKNLLWEHIQRYLPENNELIFH